MTLNHTVNLRRNFDKPKKRITVSYLNFLRGTFCSQIVIERVYYYNVCYRYCLVP
jgi:hypothetical protein